MKRSVAIVVVCILTLVLIVLGRVYLESRSAFSQAEQALKKSEFERAVTWYRRSIQWYLPVNSYVRRSRDRLLTLGDRASKAGQTKNALLAYRELRAALYSVRSFYTPYRGTIDECEKHIARLMAIQKRAQKPSIDMAAQEKSYLRQLGKDYAPNPFWSVVMVVAFFTWVGSAFGLIWRGFDSDGKFLPARALIWGGTLCAALILWVVGMRLA